MQEPDTRKLVSCILKGGLANQMFQISNMVAFARRNGYLPVFDTSVRESPSMIRPAPTYWDTVFSQIVQLGGGASLDHRQARLIREPSFEYTRIPPVADKLVFWGYFFSYRYFHDSRGRLLDLIAYNPKVRGEVDAAEKRLRDRIPPGIDMTVAVHVRRGDYLKTDSFAQLTPDYYRRAAARFKKACFVVFSDDISWCREHLCLGEVTLFVEGQKDYVDLLLMARCDHHIIANSTFSWWGAYLNENANARVLYPYPWFAGVKHRSRDMSHVFPGPWTRCSAER